MNKKLAFDNRLCYERSVARQHAIHQQKIQAMVPTALSPSKVYLDSNEPTKQPHLGTNAKRKQLDKERQMAISMQNQLLASKMDHILHRQENALLAASSTYGTALKSPRTAGGINNTHRASETSSPRTPMPPSNPSTSERSRRLNGGAGHDLSPLSKTPLLSPKKPFTHSPARVHMPGIRLDATQTPLVDCYLSPEVAIGRGAACNKRTLINRGVQKRQQERIAEENRRMRQRVEGQKPFYNTKKWDSDWQKTDQKFGHIRHNGTIGYLLPPPKTANGGEHPSNAVASPRTRMTQRNIKTSHGLPLIQHETSRSHQQNVQDTHTSSKSRPSHHHPPPPTSSKRGIAVEQHRQRERYDCEEDSSDDRFQVAELQSCVLLEATTRKGVQIQVEELQIELMKADHSLSSEDDAGDRGLVIRGKWLEDIEGEHSVSVKTLERIAQEIDDLEIMIKLETVHRIPHVGNFPRLSVLLTEEELEKLLFRLVQRLNIEVFEDRKELVISTRPYRVNAIVPLPPSLPGVDTAASSGSLESERKHRRRPRTCPSTMPSSSVHGEMDFMYPFEADDVAVRSVAASQEDNLMRLQLGSWLNIGKRSFGIRLNDTFYLVRISFSTEASTLTMTGVFGGSTPVCIKKQVAYSANQVKILVQQLESQRPTRDALVIQEIKHKLLLDV